MLNEDYKDILRALVGKKVRFLLTKADLEREGTVFQIGVAPRRIDIITTASGLRFEDAFANATAVEIEGLEVRVPSVADLIRNKRATGRTRDLAAAEALEELDS